MEQPTQDCLLEFKPHFRNLFGKFLLKCKTNVFCVKLEHVIHLLKVFLLFYLFIYLSNYIGVYDRYSSLK